jgi:hypothetical protein
MRHDEDGKRKFAMIGGWKGKPPQMIGMVKAAAAAAAAGRMVRLRAARRLDRRSGGPVVGIGWGERWRADCGPEDPQGAGGLGVDGGAGVDGEGDDEGREAEDEHGEQ